MQLLQKVDFCCGLLCWLFGIEDLDAIPLILNTRCFTQGLAPGVDRVMELASQSSSVSSASRLRNGVLGLPFFFPLLLPPFSLHVSEVARITTVASDDAPFLSDPEADRSRTSPGTAASEADWGARKLAAAVDLSSRPGVPLPPLEYASACSSHNLSCWELENERLPRMEIEGARTG